MIDVKAFGGDPSKWSRAVMDERDRMRINAKFDSCCGYITAKSKGWRREIFPAPCFSSIDAIRKALKEYEA